MRTPEAIRTADIGFVNEASRYTNALAHAELPAQLEPLKYAISWPVDMSNPLMHVSCYFGERNYSGKKDEKPHDGIDIQAPKGTEVVAPENLTLVSVLNDTFWDLDRGLVDVILHGESGLAYWLGHLDSSSIPNMSRKQVKLLDYKFDPNSGIVFKQGEVVGKVGLWFGKALALRGHTELYDGKEIPEDIKASYGRSYNHIHITTQASQRTTVADTYLERAVDPISLLGKLY